MYQAGVQIRIVYQAPASTGDSAAGDNCDRNMVAGGLEQGFGLKSERNSFLDTSKRQCELECIIVKKWSGIKHDDTKEQHMAQEAGSLVAASLCSPE